MEAEINFMHESAVRCLSTGMGRSPPNPGSLFYVLRYPNGQRESKCVLAQEALSLYSYPVYRILQCTSTAAEACAQSYILDLSRQVFFSDAFFP